MTTPWDSLQTIIADAEQRGIDIAVAIRSLQPVRLIYFTASSGKIAERQVDPYQLHPFNGE